MITRDDPGVAWLLATGEPAVRMLTLRDVLREPHDHPEVAAAREAFATGPITHSLLDGHGENVYAKWQGAFRRLTALVELDVPAEETTANAYLDAVLTWIRELEQRRYPPVVAGRARAHAVWHRHALAASVTLNRAADPVTAALTKRLVEWQWPDGGWNCDRRPEASCSSVHESLGSLWGLAV